MKRSDEVEEAKSKGSSGGVKALNFNYAIIHTHPLFSGQQPSSSNIPCMLGASLIRHFLLFL